MTTPIIIDPVDLIGRVHTMWTSTGTALFNFKVTYDPYGDYQVEIQGNPENGPGVGKVTNTKKILKDSKHGR
jgi:hypothetical protein